MDLSLLFKHVLLYGSSMDLLLYESTMDFSIAWPWTATIR